MTRNKSFVAAAAGCLALLASAAFAENASDAQAVPDSQITNRVMGKLGVDDPDAVRLVQVATKDGIVTLSGKMYTAMQAAKVLRDAQSVAGVVKVQNRLTF